MNKKTARLKDKYNREICENQVVVYEGRKFDIIFCNGAFKMMERKSSLDGVVDIWLHEIVGRHCECNEIIKSLEIIED